MRAAGTDPKRNGTPVAKPRLRGLQVFSRGVAPAPLAFAQDPGPPHPNSLRRNPSGRSSPWNRRTPTSLQIAGMSKAPMKPRTEKRPIDDFDDVLNVEDGSNEETDAVRLKLPKPVRVPTSFDALFLMLIGISACGLGMTLSLGPRLSWKLSQIAEGFRHLGVEGGVLVMGGLTMIALGLLRRGQVALRTPTTEQAEDRQLIEQLTKDSLRAAADLSRLESGLAHVEGELSATRQELAQRIAASAREISDLIPPPQEIPSPDEAIFRLAASLDQVGMRIEQRLKAQYTALQDHLEDVGAAILSARNHMQGLSQSSGQQAAVLREEMQAQVESALEETGFWANGRNSKLPSLGVLDTLDDQNVTPVHDLGSVSSALPVNPEEAREHGATTAFPGSAEDINTKTRLVQLSSLLADPNLRKALEGMRNSNP